MQRLSFRKEDACEFCGGNEYDISATLIACTRCGVTYGRCNEIWVIDDTTMSSDWPKDNKDNKDNEEK